MREFWVASGHHLTRRADHGGLVATPELIMAYLARPELMPPADACDAERDLHASLMADPLRAVSGADIARLADADARENWSFMMNFRDRLMAAEGLSYAQRLSIAGLRAAVAFQNSPAGKSYRAAVPGVIGDTAKPKESTFEVTGDFSTTCIHRRSRRCCNSQNLSARWM